MLLGPLIWILLIFGLVALFAKGSCQAVGGCSTRSHWHHHPHRIGLQEKICSKCNTHISDSFIYCPNCKAELKRKCSKCGTTMEAHWQCCPHCGEN